ncbi:MAG TPA: helix-turn-helix transcriptional regulator [Candidatus Acidoferrales bacterium]
MPSTPFGEHLKRERELRGVTLEEVAAATRISPRFLEALENEQWDRLPGGAFNRGFIRSVARYLGLDEENMVAEYALETKGLNQSSASPDSQGMPRDWRPAITGTVVLVVVIIILAVGIHYYRARERARAASPSQSTPVAPSTPIAPPTSQPTTPANPSSPGGSH